MSTDDPFGDHLATSDGHTWRGLALHTSITHYYLALAAGRAGSLVPDTQELAAVYVFATPPAEVMRLEVQLRRNPDQFYAELFQWVAGQGIKPGSEDISAAREVVEAIMAEVEGAQQTPDVSGGGEGGGVPGKPGDAPDTPTG